MKKFYFLDIHKTVVLALFFISIFSITIFQYVSIASFIIFFLFFLCFSSNQISLNKSDIKILILFYSLPFIGLILGLYPLFRMSNEYIKFYIAVFPRIFNYLVYASFFILVKSYLNTHKILYSDVCKYYEYGCLLLVFFGIWQLLNIKFGIPYPNFETRSHIHSMDNKFITAFIGKRLTSIASEPAYLAPYLMDLFLLVYYSHRTNRRIILFLIIIVVFFTLSLSAYMNFGLIILFIYFNEKNSISKIVFSIIVIFLGLLIIYYCLPVFEAVFSRLKPDKLFQSGRLQELYIPVFYTLKESPAFGFGTCGCKLIGPLLSYKYGWVQGQSMRLPTTHFYLADYYIDYGFLGVIFYFGFLFEMKKISERQNSPFEKKRLIGLLFNFLITSMYTSDYASPRATVIIILMTGTFSLNFKEITYSRQN